MILCDKKELIINEVGCTITLLFGHHFGHFHVAFGAVVTESFKISFGKCY